MGVQGGLRELPSGPRADRPAPAPGTGYLGVRVAPVRPARRPAAAPPPVNRPPDPVAEDNTSARGEITRVLALLGTADPRALMRTAEPRYRELGLAEANADRCVLVGPDDDLVLPLGQDL